MLLLQHADNNRDKYELVLCKIRPDGIYCSDTFKTHFADEKGKNQAHQRKYRPAECECCENRRTDRQSKTQA